MRYQEQQPRQEHQQQHDELPLLVVVIVPRDGPTNVVMVVAPDSENTRGMPQTNVTYHYSKVQDNIFVFPSICRWTKNTHFTYCEEKDKKEYKSKGVITLMGQVFYF